MPYRNRLEAKVAKTLPDDFEYETTKLPYVIPHMYVPDFISDKTKEIIEVKGRFPASDRTKMLAVKAAHPEYSITIVFQNPDSPINKGSATTYAMWCEKHGIAWRKA